MSRYEFLNIPWDKIIDSDVDEALAEYICHPRKKENALRWRDLLAASPAFKQIVNAVAKKSGVNPQVVAASMAEGLGAGYLLAMRQSKRSVEIVTDFN